MGIEDVPAGLLLLLAAALPTCRGRALVVEELARRRAQGVLTFAEAP